MQGQIAVLVSISLRSFFHRHLRDKFVGIGDRLSKLKLLPSIPIHKEENRLNLHHTVKMCFRQVTR